MAKRAVETLVAKKRLELLQRFSSEVFWHFTGLRGAGDEQFRRLVSILRSGLKRSDSPQRILAADDSRRGRAEYLETRPAICLADIPLKDLPIHAARYGNCAVGFKKKSVVKNDFHPVWYVPLPSKNWSRMRRLAGKLDASLDARAADLRGDFNEFVDRVTAFVKTFDPSFLHDSPSKDSAGLNNYYYEREWRSLRDWNFAPQDVAAVLIPRHRMGDFRKQERAGGLRLTDETAVIPFELVFGL
jgi:hypothetical protein